MNDIILYGAFDRHNYGDLLFPLIMQRVINREYPEKRVEVSGLIDSDLSEFGAPKTISINKALKRAKKDAAIILAGGDIVACNWQSAYGYLLPTTIHPLYERLTWRLPKLTDYLVSRKVGLTSCFPFNLNKKDAGENRRIIYNSVGATSVSNLKDTKDIAYLSEMINNADYVTVRDHFSQKNLQNISVPSVEIAPDSATVMSTYISVEELTEKTSSSTHSILNKFKHGFIVFQISQAHVKGNTEKFAREIEKLYEELQLPVLFVAIGKAAGHNDIAGVKNIMSMLNSNVIYDSYLDGSIFDLMNIIRNSSCYCGTSLHGLITSMSFAVPRVALLPKLRKQINYMKTWDLPHMPKGINPEELVSAVKIATSTSNEDLELLSQKLTKTYMESFKKLTEFIS
ncbi:polysaccharide pyruvyl transferase family protein [Thalassotalea crassostreae]|uniref:polysaccharide pyruvyl transferase family protein n=1 Tax=Thalassotalea crassostreae TaxID=1763536 RepID=UPI00083941B3|nr:polysaccharide pyruvyl transferase family protein [Thalassotalea crassostreae]